jgi:hypothetical protein
MDNTDDFTANLKEILTERKDFILQEVLFRMKNELSYYTMTFGNLYKIFLNNGIVSKDVYRDDFKVSKIAVPPEGPFPEKNAKDEMTIRLSQFDSYLNFMLTYCTFTLDYFKPDKMKVFAALIHYIHWEKLNPNSDNFNTQQLAKLIDNDHNMKQDFTAKILTDSTKQLTKHTKNLMRDLKIISDFDRENYKLMVREKVLPKITLTKSMLSDVDKAVVGIKKVQAAELPTEHFYSNLVREIIYEELDSSGDDLKEEILKKLQSGVKKKVQENKVSPEEIFTKAVKALFAANSFLSEALMKTSSNAQNLETDKESLFVRIMIALKILPKVRDKDRFIEIDLADEGSGVSIKKTINVNGFVKSSKKIIEQVTSLKNQATSSKEDPSILLEDFNSAITTYIKTIKMLTAIHEFFKDKKGPNGVMRGINIEVSSIKNHIGNARKLRNEYYTVKGEENLLGK